MTKRLLFALTLLLGLFLSKPVKAEFAYFGFDSDIVTSYLSATSRELGYVRIAVELVVKDAGNLEIVEHHAPLLRATIVDVFGKQYGDKIKSLTGREEIRQMVLAAIQEQLKAETGSALVSNVIFTKYQYQE